MEYEFTIKFKLPDPDEDIDGLVGKLGAAGCGDALVGMGTPGQIALKFSREAESTQLAVESAIRDLQKAVPSAVPHIIEC